MANNDISNDDKEKLKKAANNSLDAVKEKSEEAQEKLLCYIKENPMKSVGFALLAGVIAAKLI